MRNINKVAQITIIFWVMKIIATTLGETLGDLFSMTLNLGYLESLCITMCFFLIVLFFQIKVKKFYPVLYWLVIVGTTTVGTEISDFMDRTLSLGYFAGSLILFSMLIITLTIWFIQEKSLSVYPVYTTKVEWFYWIAILFSNSLGTAFGDFLSDNMGFSYLQGALITSGIIIIVIGLHYYTQLNRIVLFWIAFVFTRPFGATFGDLLTKPVSKGGIHLGTFYATIVTTFLLSVLVYIRYKKIKTSKYL